MNTKTFFKTFPSGSGDCIFVLIVDTDNNNQYSIMVDCGTLTDEIEEYIKNTLRKRIDYLIVTHIDADHVNGVTKLLNKPEFADLQIGRILFNCFQSQPNAERKDLEQTTQKRIDALLQKMPPQYVLYTGKTSGQQAATLAKPILQNPAWRDAWVKEQIICGQEFEIGSQECKIVMLSPKKENLDELLAVFKSEFHKWTHIDFPDYAVVDQEDIFQKIIELADAKSKSKPSKKTGAPISIEKELSDAAKEDADEDGITPSNKASLAFMIQTPDRSILIMGDAPSSNIYDALGCKDREGVIVFDAIKVSHHGSKHNTSTGFVSKVDSHDWFITGGNRKDRPSLEAIGKIVLRSLTEGMNERVIHYNFPNVNTDKLNTENGKALQSSKNFKMVENGEL